MINGLFIYTNIVWHHQRIISSQKETKGTHFLITFIAWLNLDFGIFSSGLSAYEKACNWLRTIYVSLLHLDHSFSNDHSSTIF